ncbi:FGGY family carbohydrate kinase [uncultured Thalassospira sp.]|uniref:FGGY-family carbohydrate kinase n=1 Tax=uncultured Thalassospira sp. TaxID=404382 RepID=UPI0030DC93D7
MTQTRPNAIAVFDIGKTNAKISIRDAQNARLFCEQKQANTPLPGPPYRHHDIDGLWHFCLAQLQNAAEKFNIIRIVVTTHGATIVVMQGDRVALPVVDYENEIPAVINTQYKTLRDPFAHSLSPDLPAGLNIGRQLYALSQTHKDAFHNTSDILLYPQYWAWRLCGVKASECTSLGCHSDLWQPTTGQWSALAQKQGWAAKFPPLQKADAVIGTLLPEIAAQTGISPNCEILCGIHDSNASLVPYIQTMPKPFTLVSTGTWVICFAVGSSATHNLREDRDTLCNVDLDGHAVPSARFMGGREYETLCPKADTPFTMDDIDHVIDQGIYAIPSFATAGGPFSGHTGAVENHAGLATPARHSALATLYGALMIDYCLGMIGASGPLILDGPFAQNRHLCQILALFRPEQPLHIASGNAGTSYGAALLALSPQNREMQTGILYEIDRELTGPHYKSYRHQWFLRLPRS